VLQIWKAKDLAAPLRISMIVSARVCVAYITIPSVCKLHTVELQTGWWIIHLKEFTGKQSWGNRGSIPAFAWRKWGKLWTPSDRIDIACVPAGFEPRTCTMREYSVVTTPIGSIFLANFTAGSTQEERWPLERVLPTYHCTYVYLFWIKCSQWVLQPRKILRSVETVFTSSGTHCVECFTFVASSLATLI
jgi:hypothetical protein